MFDLIFTERFGFQPFGTEHFLVATTLSFLGIGLIAFGRGTQENQATRLGKMIGWTIFCIEILWLTHKWTNGTFKAKENLPLDLCNVCALLIPLAMMRRNESLFQIMYFWVLTFSLQGLFTPDMEWAFPYIGYLKYWVIHTGLVIAVLYGVFVYRWRPSLRGLFLAFGAIQIWAVLVYLINLANGSNYGYLMHKPVNPSLFDYFGTHYIMVVQGVALALFVVLWLPFLDKKVDFRHKKASNTEGGQYEHVSDTVNASDTHSSQKIKV